MADLLSRRQVEIALAAGQVFLANGYARTTMAELAAAAGLSRQGLYLIFPNKDAAFTAAVRVLDDRLHADIEAGLAGRRGLTARLAYACDRWIGGLYDLQQSTPAAKDMDDLDFPIVRHVYDRFIDMISGVIRDGAPRVAPREADDLARVLVFAIRGFSATARDGSDMRRLMKLQIRLVVEALEASRAATLAG